MHTPSPTRYDVPDGWFRRCGTSGLTLPAISLGCWHNFGGAGTDPRSLPEREFHANVQRMLFTAFDRGVTHFDLANNYGPPPGSAEQRVGTVLRNDLAGYRDELIISSKAGYRMWDGPYGSGSSRKYLLASLDQSLSRLGLDYVDIFYSHCYDETTPLEETLGALDSAVRAGKALHVGISSYSAAKTAEVLEICSAQGLVRPIIHQPSYSMLDRWVEGGLLDVTASHGLGVIAFCPLAQGLLTDKYLRGIPDASRARQESGALQETQVSEDLISRLQRLNDIARQRGQSLAQLALAWVLRPSETSAPAGPVTSALIGASRPEQIEDCVRALEAGPLTEDERRDIEEVLASG
jgi:L-glyceraldehyde 3-phosphate reductase